MRVTFGFERGSGRVEIRPLLQNDLSPNALALPADPAREFARPGRINDLTRAIPLLVERPLLAESCRWSTHWWSVGEIYCSPCLV